MKELLDFLYPISVFGYIIKGFAGFFSIYGLFSFIWKWIPRKIDLSIGSFRVRTQNRNYTDVTNLTSSLFYGGGRIDDKVRNEIIAALRPKIWRLEKKELPKSTQKKILVSVVETAVLPACLEISKNAPDYVVLICPKGFKKQCELLGTKVEIDYEIITVDTTDEASIDTLSAELTNRFKDEMLKYLIDRNAQLWAMHFIMANNKKNISIV